MIFIEVIQIIVLVIQLIKAVQVIQVRQVKALEHIWELDFELLKVLIKTKNYWIFYNLTI